MGWIGKRGDEWIFQRHLSRWWDRGPVTRSLIRATSRSTHEMQHAIDQWTTRVQSGDGDSYPNFSAAVTRPLSHSIFGHAKQATRWTLEDLLEQSAITTHSNPRLNAYILLLFTSPVVSFPPSSKIVLSIPSDNVSPSILTEYAAMRENSRSLDSTVLRFFVLGSPTDSTSINSVIRGLNMLSTTRSNMVFEGARVRVVRKGERSAVKGTIRSGVVAESNRGKDRSSSSM